MGSIRKYPEDGKSRIISKIYRCLVICLFSLGLIFLGGTIYGVFFLSSTLEQTKTTNQYGQELGQGQTFTGIGLLRVPTADPQPGTVIIFTLFDYDPEDKAFSEELTLRIRDFREILIGYLGSFSVYDLQNQKEDFLKSEILRRFNEILQLGKIKTLYFSEFIIVE